MAEGYFNGADYYDTPTKPSRSLWAKFLIGNRLYFTFKYATVTLRSGKMARKGIYHDKEWAASSKYIFDFIEKSGGCFHISGMNNINKENEPVLFVANHMSTLETMILPCLISPLKKVTFVVKESLIKHPLFKDIMLSRDPIVVGREDPRKDLEAVMTKGLELLKKGTSIIIFPQSTRSLVFEPEKFNSMGIKLAQKAGVKVVPVALKTDFWGSGKLIKEVGPIYPEQEIYFNFGEPFTPEGPGKIQNQKVIDFIQESLSSWGGEQKI
jgi:1-acyl-sn-glycerol-3-phosphate acyltransferase